MSVLTPAGCVAGLATILAAVPGVGQVHRQRRQLRDEASLRRYLWDGQRMNGWFLSPAPATTTVSDRKPGFYAIGQQGGGQVLTTFQWQIEGYYELNDAQDSETRFRDLAWSIADTFNSYGLIAVEGLVEQLPCDIEQFGYATIANLALLHYARLNIGLYGRTRPA